MLISPEMQSAWTQLWSSGHFESLPEDRAAGRLEALDAAWTEYLAKFSPDARLLDLATGGGDVIRRAAAFGRDFNITGVDLADLSAVKSALTEPNIELIGCTDLARLPFPDAIFDGVMSQFGLEYADIASATNEAVRVLVPGGRGYFVLHHVGSAVTQGVVNSLEAERLVFTDVEPFELGKTVFRLYRQGASPETIARAETALRNAVTLMQSRLQNKPGFEPAQRVVAFFARLALSPRDQAPTEALNDLAIVEEQVQSRILRKVAQLDAALDGNGIDKVAGSLANGGAIVTTPRELKCPGGPILAWSLSFHKPA
jgi:ubiquinone/menaquinone biosynthesis C-methylase UbiE